MNHVFHLKLFISLAIGKACNTSKKSSLQIFWQLQMSKKHEKGKDNTS